MCTVSKRSLVWIQHQHGLNSESEKIRKEPSATTYKIKKALDFMRNQSLEVPFIAFYRKEYVSPELTLSDLWKVYKYDEKVGQKYLETLKLP